jgi:DNA polymerase III epsilon subunit-like protein
METLSGAQPQMDVGHHFEEGTDVYFSADVETDGPIPGPFSILSFALVYAGSFDGRRFSRPKDFRHSFYREMQPISQEFQPEALRVNGLDREKLSREGRNPEIAMDEASRWVWTIAGKGKPVLVAYPLSFDWSWLYWYFVRFAKDGSPFRHSSCFDIKTAIAVKGHLPISLSSRPKLSQTLISQHTHTHNALDDAAEQAEIFANVFDWDGDLGHHT